MLLSFKVVIILLFIYCVIKFLQLTANIEKWTDIFKFNASITMKYVNLSSQ
jgi:hypothetical protein